MQNFSQESSFAEYHMRSNVAPPPSSHNQFNDSPLRSLGISKVDNFKPAEQGLSRTNTIQSLLRSQRAYSQSQLGMKEGGEV